MYLILSECLDSFCKFRMKTCCIRIVLSMDRAKSVRSLSSVLMLASSNIRILLNSFLALVGRTFLDLSRWTLGGSGIFFGFWKENQIGLEL